MLWEVEIQPQPNQVDREGRRVLADCRALGVRSLRDVCSGRSFLIQGELDGAAVERIAAGLLADTVVETYTVRELARRAGGVSPLVSGEDDRASEGVSDGLKNRPTGDATDGLKNRPTDALLLNVLYKPGVTDNVAQSTRGALRDLGLPVEAVATCRKYWVNADADESELDRVASKVLANDAIEQVVRGPLAMESIALGSPYEFKLTTVPIRGMSDDELMDLSRTGQLYLSLAEMQTIRQHFIEQDRDPTDAELETLAQTWSEHCSHKTLAGRIRYRVREAEVRGQESEDRSQRSEVRGQRSEEEAGGREQEAGIRRPEAGGRDHSPLTTHHSPQTTDHPGYLLQERHFENMLKETIFAATVRIREELGEDDWCVSVFKDNAGIVRFDEKQNVCFKVETHNHPSALEPYGGANTGLGGVIRDPLGTGLGARPVCNTDVFCFAPPDTPLDALPPGVLHPRVVMRGVVAGVRDYGNRMGIPTVNGAVYFDERYLGNPLVYCGNVAMIPVDKCEKRMRPGDMIVAVGGRTGRDGIHGATFSSAELTHESETLSGGAVQIGNAITEKMVADVVLQARDRNLYSAITDCGAGGFSSAVGEMGEETGAEVWLDRAPLKYAGLSYTEIWISEAQERMVLAVPPENWDEFHALCASEGVEATVIGRFTDTRRLVLKYHDQQVADLSMKFLHDGRPPVVREAVFSGQWPVASGQRSEVRGQRSDEEAGGRRQEAGGTGRPTTHHSPLTTHHSPPATDHGPRTTDLLRILSSLNVCSKEWIIRQYDHEVQGGSVVKPLVGVEQDGPSDAAVVRPDLTSNRGLVIACGMNPRFGDLDPYWMAASAIDEAVRNCVAVGADPRRIAILDNFCWGNTERPEILGSLVRAALACYDVAVAYRTPFISGKDSLNNDFSYIDADGRRRTVTVPPSLLISALGQIEDVQQAVTMDLKQPGNLIYLVGPTMAELGGSHYELVTGQAGGDVPRVDVELAPRLFAAVHQAIRQGLVRSSHDLSEGGLAVAAAEMSFAGGLGVELDLQPLADATSLDDETLLFSESNTRFLLEVPAARRQQFESLLADLPLALLGRVCDHDRVTIAGTQGQPVIDALWSELKEAWQQPLAWD